MSIITPNKTFLEDILSKEYKTSKEESKRHIVAIEINKAKFSKIDLFKSNNRLLTLYV